MTTQNNPIYSLPFLYKSGLIISNDTTTPNTVLDIAAGQCRDSNDVMDITLGTANPNIQGETVSTPVLLNAAVNGFNGLDTGTFAEATMYAIYAIGDSRYYNPCGVIMTLASNSSPLMPFGYDSYRLIGFWATISSAAHFLPGYYSGTGGALLFTYDAPQATTVTAGGATSYTGIALTALVPPIANTPVQIYSSFVPAAASHVLKMQGYLSTGDAVTITGQVASVAVTTTSTVLAQLNSAAPSINYKVTNGSDTAAIDVAGFQVSL